MPPVTWSLAVVANYGISDSVVNWRLLFDIVSWEMGEIPPTPRQNQWVENSRDGWMIQSQSKLFKANQGFFGKNFSFLKTEWKKEVGFCALASLLLTSLGAVR